MGFKLLTDTFALGLWKLRAYPTDNLNPTQETVRLDLGNSVWFTRLRSGCPAFFLPCVPLTVLHEGLFSIGNILKVWFHHTHSLHHWIHSHQNIIVVWSFSKGKCSVKKKVSCVKSHYTLNYCETHMLNFTKFI